MTKRWPSSDTIVTMSSIVTSLFRNTASTNALLLLSLASAYILIRLIMAPRSRVENSSTTARTESDAVRKLKFILPKLPLLTRVTLLRIMGLSEPAKYMDLYSELTLNVIRFYTIPARPRTITQVQAILNTDRPSKGRVWISRVASPVPPEDGIRDALRTAVESLAAEAGIAEDALAFKWPDLVPVEAEWTGYRSAASADARLPEHLTQRQLYDELMREATRPTTVLYFHGGAHYLLDPSTHRHATKTLAKLTGGRCYSVRYRLAPQNPFPAGLLDAFVAYFTLLYPPPGSFHEPVRPEHIVFAGDRSVGCFLLCFLPITRLS